MDKDILNRKTAVCVLLKNHGNKNYVEIQESNAVVELFVYEKVSVKDNYSDMFCPLNKCHYIVLNWRVISPDGDYTVYLYIQ